MNKHMKLLIQKHGPKTITKIMKKTTKELSLRVMLRTMIVYTLVITLRATTKIILKTMLRYGTALLQHIQKCILRVMRKHTQVIGLSLMRKTT